MGDGLIHLPDVLFQQGFQTGGGAAVHKGLDLGQGDIQLPQHQDGLQGLGLAVGVVPVAVFRVDGGGLEQADLVIPHQGLLVDVVQGRELADGKARVLISAHVENTPLTVLLLYGI